MCARARGSRLRPVLRLAPVLVFATVLLLFSVPAAAFAATFSDRSPAPGAVVGGDDYVSVTVTYPGGNFQYGMTIDGVTYWPWQLNIQRPNATTIVLRTQNRVVMRDGARTVRVTITDATGTYADEWSFTGAVKPKASAPYPAPGSTSGVPRPRIGLRMTDDTPGKLNVRLRVDGAQVFLGQADQGDWRCTPGSDLSNNTTHTVIADVSDAGGNTSSLTWSFGVSAAAAMTVPPTCTGPGCHPTYPAAHPMDGCEACHQARSDIRPGPNHDLYYYADDVGCLDCHDAHGPRDPARWFCDTCHSSAAPSVSQHTASNTAGLHLSTTVGCEPCHEDGLLAEHGKYPRDSEFKNQCDTCHASPDARVKTAIAQGATACSACHSMGTEHDSHPAQMGPAWIPIFENHDGLGPLGMQVDCATCHTSADLIVVHDEDCDACHGAGGPVASLQGWNGTCRQGECHPTIHSSAAEAHDAIAAAGCEAACHDEADWSVTAERCAECHSGSEGVPPSTTSDASASYAGAASIKLTPSDPRPSSGLDATYHRLDGRAATEGVSVYVAGPSSGTEQHALEFWSVDNAGNIEAAKSVTFTISADTEAPVTRSDAKASYVGSARITLTATDDSDVPVDATYNRLDGGQVTAGTVISVPGPASGTATHTLEFWSVDGAGVEELPHKSVSFGIAADPDPPVTTSNAPLYDRTSAPLRVDFVASDGPAGSGVASTWARILPAAPCAGSWYYVSSYGINDLEFWSVDRAGNEEEHHTVRIIKDPWPPSTTSDAREAYVSSAEVRLTAADSGAAGVASTYYTVDGGERRTGTSLSIASIGTHTVRYWSVDRAGNVEAVKSATFNVASPEPGNLPTGTVVMRWASPPPGSWTYYYVYDAAGGLIAADHNTTGVCSFTVPVSPQAYTIKTYWYDSEGEECRPVWSSGTALVDTPGKTVTWDY